MIRPSARELEVLAAVVRCGGTREAALELVVSPRTVRSHVSHILDKLGVSTLYQSVALLDDECPGWRLEHLCDGNAA
jgi:DNA-binding NarL/FixJ family response regulator